MITDMVNLMIAFFLPWVTGYALIILISGKDQLPAPLRIALSWGMGTGAVALSMMLLGAADLALTRASVSLVLIAILGVSLAVTARQHPECLRFRSAAGVKDHMPRARWSVPVSLSLFKGLLIFYITLNLLYVFARAVGLPVHSWDALATVAFKAKIFYFENRLPSMNALPHATYPLLVPFNETWVAFNLGHWSDTLIKSIFPFTLISFLMIQYHFLKTFTNKMWALMGCALLLSSNLFLLHATISYRDFFLMYYNCSVILLFCLWAKTLRSSYLWIASLFAGLATFTKLEGTAFMMVYVLVFLMLSARMRVDLKTRILHFFQFTVPAGLIMGGFHLYKITHRVLQDGVGANDKTALILSFQRLELLPSVLIKYFHELFFTGNWNILWFVLLVSLVHLWRRSRRHNREIQIIGTSLIMFFGLYAAVAVFTSNFPWIAGAKSASGISRLILHFFPLSVTLIILLNYPLKEEKPT
jgi:uncharacterized MnhB-related membrane protein